MITKRGKPVLETSKPQAALRRVELGELRALTKRMPQQKQGAGAMIRELRDEARY